MFDKKQFYVITAVVVGLLHGAVRAADVRTFVPGKAWEISVDVNGFEPWDNAQRWSTMAVENPRLGLLVLKAAHDITAVTNCRNASELVKWKSQLNKFSKRS